MAAIVYTGFTGRLMNIRITDAGLVHLGGLTHQIRALKWVKLWSTKVTKAAVEELRRAPIDNHRAE